MENSKLLLIDGSSVLSSSFYGTVPYEYKKAKSEEEYQKALPKLMHTSDGTYYTNGVYTFFKILLNIIENQKPSHLVVAWDKTRNTFRRELYPNYKANRKATRPELQSQFGLMQKALEYIGVKQFVYDKYEADDILGTLSKKFETEVDTYILTKDRDCLQLLSPKTKVWLITSKAQDMYKEIGVDTKALNVPNKVFEYTEEALYKITGLKPYQIIDLKALEGDASDNIPGVKGVGEKSAIPLIKKFDNIENLYKFINTMSKEDEDLLKSELKTMGVNRSPIGNLTKTSSTELVGEKAAILSKQLATIKTDIDDLDSLSLTDLSLAINEPRMLKTFIKLEMNSLINKEKLEKSVS